MLTVEVPAAEQVAAVVVTVGTAGEVPKVTVTGVLVTDSHISSKVKLWKQFVVLAVVVTALVRLVTLPINLIAPVVVG